MASRPTVFVSSTCYDLGELRLTLRRALSELGWEPMLSEFPSFPVDPDLTTVENCRKAVRDHADVFVLVVGSRYGTLDSTTGKSVTNVEFLEARAQGIPCYAFVKAEVQAYLAAWRKNPDGDFSHLVDSNELFRFIESLSGAGDIWMFPFTSSNNIIEYLREQLPYLVRDSLAARRRLSQPPHSAGIRNLSGISLKLALERPRGWEYKLFHRLVEENFQSLTPDIRDAEQGLFLTFSRFLTTESLVDWLGDRIYDLTRFSEATTTLINEFSQTAFGSPGAPGDPEAIVYLADRIARCYRYSIEWRRKSAEVRVDDRFRTLLSLFSAMADEFRANFDDFRRQIADLIAEVDQSVATGLPLERTLTLRLTAPDAQTLLDEMDSLRQAGAFRGASL